MENWALLVGMGMAAGIMGGLFGVGGGVVYVPMLGWWLSLHGFDGAQRVQMVLGNSLALTLITGVLGMWLWKRRGVYEPGSWLIMGIPAGMVAVGVAWFLQQNAIYDPAVFRIVFSGILAVMLVRNAWGMFRVKADFSEAWDCEPSRQTYAILGSLAGLFSALTGLGGGAIMVPALHSLGMRDQARINALSMGAIATMALASTMYYAGVQGGGLAPSFLLPTAVGTLLGIWPGIILARRFSQHPVHSCRLRLGLLAFLTMVLLWVNRDWILRIG
jgi:uncharacterized membrane protein YfcA